LIAGGGADLNALWVAFGDSSEGADPFVAGELGLTKAGTTGGPLVGTLSEEEVGVEEVGRVVGEDTLSSA